MQLFRDVAPHIPRFPRLAPLNAEECAAAAILAQLRSQLVARFLRFMQRWLFWLLLRFLLQIAMPQRRKKLSPRRRMKPVLRRTFRLWDLF